MFSAPFFPPLILASVGCWDESSARRLQFLLGTLQRLFGRQWTSRDLATVLYFVRHSVSDLFPIGFREMLAFILALPSFEAHFMAFRWRRHSSIQVTGFKNTQDENKGFMIRTSQLTCIDPLRIPTKNFIYKKKRNLFA